MSGYKSVFDDIYERNGIRRVKVEPVDPVDSIFQSIYSRTPQIPKNMPEQSGYIPPHRSVPKPTGTDRDMQPAPPIKPMAEPPVSRPAPEPPPLLSKGEIFQRYLQNKEVDEQWGVPENNWLGEILGIGAEAVKDLPGARDALHKAANDVFGETPGKFIDQIKNSDPIVGGFIDVVERIGEGAEEMLIDMPADMIKRVEGSDDPGVTLAEIGTEFLKFGPEMTRDWFFAITDPFGVRGRVARERIHDDPFGHVLFPYLVMKGASKGVKSKIKAAENPKVLEKWGRFDYSRVPPEKAIEAAKQRLRDTGIEREIIRKVAENQRRTQNARMDVLEMQTQEARQRLNANADLIAERAPQRRVDQRMLDAKFLSDEKWQQKYGDIPRPDLTSIEKSVEVGGKRYSPAQASRAIPELEQAGARNIAEIESARQAMAQRQPAKVAEQFDPGLVGRPFKSIRDRIREATKQAKNPRERARWKQLEEEVNKTEKELSARATVLDERIKATKAEQTPRRTVKESPQKPVTGRSEPTPTQTPKKEPTPVRELKSKPETAESTVRDVPLGRIRTDVDRFQNRQKAFSEETASAVERHYDPNKFDPVVLWKDPQSGESYVLSGHSRLEGMRRRGAESVPSRYFEGTLEEAQNFSRIEANRLQSKETLVESINAYNQALRENYTKSKMKELFGSETGLIDDVRHLDRRGKFLEVLDQPASSEFPFAKRFARWTGELREKYPDKLTPRHENQIFDFLYLEKGRNYELGKERFIDLIEKNVSRADFTPNSPLVLKKSHIPVVGTRARADTRRIEEKIERLRAQRDNAKTQAEVDALNAEISKLRDGIAEIVKNQEDIFSGLGAKPETAKPKAVQVKLEPTEVSDLMFYYGEPQNIGMKRVIARLKGHERKQPLSDKSSGRQFTGKIPEAEARLAAEEIGKDIAEMRAKGNVPPERIAKLERLRDKFLPEKPGITTEMTPAGEQFTFGGQRQVPTDKIRKTGKKVRDIQTQGDAFSPGKTEIGNLPQDQGTIELGFLGVTPEVMVKGAKTLKNAVRFVRDLHKKRPHTEFDWNGYLSYTRAMTEPDKSGKIIRYETRTGDLKEVRVGSKITVPREFYEHGLNQKERQAFARIYENNPDKAIEALKDKARYKDVHAGSLDPIRLIETIDGALSIKEQASLPGQAGPAKRYVDWRTRDLMLARAEFLAELQNKSRKIFKGLSKDQDIQVFHTLGKISRRGAYVSPEKLLGNKRIAKITSDIQVVKAAQDMRKLLESLLKRQNEIRAMRGQSLIPHREYYTPEQIRKAGIIDDLLQREVGRANKDIFDKPDMPDFIHVDKVFTPHELPQKGKIPSELRVEQATTILENYINAAAKDIFNTSIIQNNKAFAKALRKMGYQKSAAAIEEWTSGAFAGVSGHIDKAVSLKQRPVLNKTLSLFRNALTRSVFPLNVAWSTVVQPSSHALAVYRYGLRNTANGAKLWLTDPKFRDLVQKESFSYKIKTQNKQGHVTKQGVNTGVGNIKVKPTRFEKLEDIATFHITLVERHLTGMANGAAYLHGKQAGLNGRSLIEYMSDGGSKVHSMYNYEHAPRTLRNYVVKTVFPFETFHYEVANTIKELKGDVGVPMKSASAGKTRMLRARRVVEAVAAMTAYNLFSQELTGRKVWEAPLSFIQFSAYWLKPVMDAITGQAYRDITTRSLPAPVGILVEGGRAAHKTVSQGDWYDLTKWLIKYGTGAARVSGGVQMGRLVDAIIANTKGAVTDSENREMFTVESFKDRIISILAGPHSTSGAKEYWKARSRKPAHLPDEVYETPVVGDLARSIPGVSDMFGQRPIPKKYRDAYNYLKETDPDRARDYLKRIRQVQELTEGR